MPRADQKTPPPTRAETLAAALAEAITAGRMPPGLPLEEEKLAAAHDMSRTPVRDMSVSYTHLTLPTKA